MDHVIQRIKSPDGALYRKGDPFPKFEDKDEPNPFVITDITLAPKQSEDVGEEGETDIEEVDASIEVWGGLPAHADQRALEKFRDAGWCFCLRVYLGTLRGLLVEEIWDLNEAMDLIKERRNLDIVDDEPEAPNGGAQAAPPAPRS